jgi:hypothetical protein
MSRKPRPKVQQELFSIKQANDYLGGNLGVHRISDLMQNGTIPGIYLGGKLTKCTTKQHLDNFIKRMFDEPIQNEILETAPITFINKF